MCTWFTVTPCDDVTGLRKLSWPNQRTKKGCRLIVILCDDVIRLYKLSVGWNSKKQQQHENMRKTTTYKVCTWLTGITVILCDDVVRLCKLNVGWFRERETETETERRKWWTKSQDSVHKPQPFWRERRAEAVSNRSPSAYQPNALPLGQTGSLKNNDDDELMLNVLRCHLTY